MSAAGRLAQQLHGLLGERLLLPADAGFERFAEVVYTGDLHIPRLLARPTRESEVARIVAVAVDADVPFAVRGRGHSFARHGIIDDGLVIDLRLMGACHIDPLARVGTSSASTTTGAYTTAASAFGLATGFGDHPDVGIPGLVLGGGFGYLSRRDGLTIDNLLDARVVLADGAVVTASEAQHPELFWALRGGGGNFGVVVQARMRLVEVARITGGFIAFEPDPATVEALFEAARTAPDEVTVMINLMKAPPAPFLPPERHGKPIITAHVCHCGNPADAATALAPLRSAGQVVVDLLGTRPYPELFTLAMDQQGTRTLRATGFGMARGNADLEPILAVIADGLLIPRP
ncbi:FAD-binding oxidoreductase [Microbacterium sp. RD1]|uniref:FAD-binding oxidoreductase n=1 Tax=Microbacterium sp. RD1 TaxID=3457313 RepID=UPI003FA57958